MVMDQSLTLIVAVICQSTKQQQKNVKVFTFKEFGETMEKVFQSASKRFLQMIDSGGGSRALPSMLTAGIENC